MGIIIVIIIYSTRMIKEIVLFSLIAYVFAQEGEELVFATETSPALIDGTDGTRLFYMPPDKTALQFWLSPCYGEMNWYVNRGAPAEIDDTIYSEETVNDGSKTNYGFPITPKAGQEVTHLLTSKTSRAAFSMATITEDLYNGDFYPQFPGNYQASQNLNVVTLTFTIDGTNLKENDGYSLWLIEEDDMKQDTDIVANTPCGFKFSGKDMSDEATMTIANGKMTVDFELRLAGTYVMIASRQGGGEAKSPSLAFKAEDIGSGGAFSLAPSVGMLGLLAVFSFVLGAAAQI